MIHHLKGAERPCLSETRHTLQMQQLRISKCLTCHMLMTWHGACPPEAMSFLGYEGKR
jgi:radical SAM protein with 4Fe4S-binding SPASM domain